MTEKWIVDDCGTLINMQTRDTFDYVSDVCDVLNEKDKSIKILTNHNKEYVRSINILEDKLKKLKELEKEMEQLKSTNMEMEDYLGRLEEANINLQIKLQKIRDYAKEDGEVKQGIIEKVIMND